MTKKHAILTSGLLVLSLVAMTPAFADQGQMQQPQHVGFFGRIGNFFGDLFHWHSTNEDAISNGPQNDSTNNRAGVRGTVSAINGNTITLTAVSMKDTTTSTYTIDATNAKIEKFVSGSAPTSITVSNIASGDTIMVFGTLSGTTLTASTIMDGVPVMGQGQQRSGVMGTVTSISGNTITVTSKNSTDTTGATYTIDATNAKILKGKNTTIAITDIKIGDTIMAQGTVTGTSVAATVIHDGVPMRGDGLGMKSGHGISGTVSAVSGNTLTVAGSNDTVYTIDATNAKILKAVSGAQPQSITVSSITVGDTVRVSGPTNGATITATYIYDGQFSRGVMMGRSHFGKASVSNTN